MMKKVEEKAVLCWSAKHAVRVLEMQGFKVCVCVSAAHADIIGRVNRQPRVYLNGMKPY